jgi:hypothetical protein
MFLDAFGVSRPNGSTFVRGAFSGNLFVSNATYR